MAAPTAPSQVPPHSLGVLMDKMVPFYDSYANYNGKRLRFILMNTGHMMAVRKNSGWCCSVTKYTLSTHMVVTPDDTCVAVADVTDPEARLFRVVGPSGSLSLRADDTADRDHWLRLLKKLKSKLEVMDDDFIAILRNETRLTREFLEAEWRYGAEPARTTTPQNVSDDVLTAGELQSRFEHKNEPAPAPKKRLPNPAVKVEFFSIPAPVHEENLSPYGQRKPMRATIRERLVAAIDVARLEHRHCVLVVDQVAACAIAKVLSVRDLRRLGVRRVHQLEQDRPFGRGSHMHAIYMVSPSFRALGTSEAASKSTEFSRKFAATVRKANATTPDRRRAFSLYAKQATVMEAQDGTLSSGEGDEAKGIAEGDAFTDDESDGNSSTDLDEVPSASDSDDALDTLHKADIQQASPRTQRRMREADLLRKAEARLARRKMTEEEKQAELDAKLRAELEADMKRRPTIKRHTSLDLFLRDHRYKSGGMRKRRRYKSAALLLASHVDSAVTARLKEEGEANGLGRWLKKVLIVNSDFVAVESQVFHMDMPNCAVPLFAPNPSSLGFDRSVTQQHIAARLVSLCVSLNEFPFIRYKASNPMNGAVASLVRDGLNEHLRDDPAFWFHGMHDEKQQACLLILSRSDDVVSPLMHEFSYQAMVYDVYDVHPAAPVPAVTNAQRKHVLDEADSLWQRDRHTHVNRVVDHALAAAERAGDSPGRFVSPNAAGLTQRQEDVLAEAMGVLPELDARNTAGRHLAIANHCLHVSKQNQWEDVAEFEQTLATGCNHKGSVPFDYTLRKTLRRLLDGMAYETDKLRLAMLYVVTRGGLNDHEYDLLSTALAPASMRTLQQLENFNLPVRRPKNRSVKRVGKTELTAAKRLAKSCERAEDWLCRASPALFETVWRHCQAMLHPAAFPFLYDPPLSYFGAVLGAASVDGDSEGGEGGERGSSGSARPKTLDRRHVTMNYDEFMLNEEDDGHVDGSGDGAANNGSSDKSGTGVGAGAGAGAGVGAGAGECKQAGDSRPVALSGLTVDVGKEPVYHKPRLIVFVMGGITFAEMKAVYKLSKEFDQEVLLGGTSIVTAREFLLDLRVMASSEDDSDGGSDSAPEASPPISKASA